MPTPPSFDRALLAHLGELARLSLPGERLAALGGQLQRIVDAFSALADADLGELPDDEVTIAAAALRPDTPAPVPTPAEVLANAPQQAADCFVVPRVVEP